MISAINATAEMAIMDPERGFRGSLIPNILTLEFSSLDCGNDIADVK